jgi:tetratricopeptide (TPR) repeat protein
MHLSDARAFLACGDFAQAKNAFLAAMVGDRYNLDGMLGLGDALIGLADYQSARIVLVQAVAHHPDSSEAHSALGGVLLELDDLEGARAAFERALSIDPSLRKPHAGIAVIYERAGDHGNADRAWLDAFREGGPPVSVYRGEGKPVRVLLLKSAAGGNVPLGGVFDDRIFQVITLFVESYQAAMVLPDHDIVFNAFGNVEISTRAIDKAERLADATSVPIVNHPALVRHTSRTAVADRLREIPGIVTPRVRAVSKRELAGDCGLGWPLLVRSLGFHGGEHFVKVDHPSQLRDAVAPLSGDDVLAIEYVETRHRDGMFRKYRMLCVDGQLYPSHLAIGEGWKVHYFSAKHGAAIDAGEQAFLANPEGAIGTAALRALERAAATLTLDYAGFDFALDAGGRVVIFEANATMRVGENVPVIQALRTMVAARAAISP